MSVTAFNRRRRLLAAAPHAAQNRPVEAEKVSAMVKDSCASVEAEIRQSGAQKAEKGGRKHGRTSQKAQDASGD
jgi:hypothetical protein